MSLPDHIVTELRSAYESGQYGAVAKISRRYKIEITRLYSYARLRGWSKRNVEVRRPWGDIELDLIADNAHLSDDEMRRLLARNGYRRSIASIDRARWKLGASVRNSDRYTASTLAEAMGTSATTVTRWLHRGLIRSSRYTGNGAQSDAFVIRPEDVRRFLIENPGEWDHRLCNKWWLIDILSGDHRPREAGMVGSVGSDRVAT